MNFSQTVKYLEELETKELLEKRNYGNNGNFIYETSEKGRKVLKAYGELNFLIKDYLNFVGYASELRNSSISSRALSTMKPSVR